MPAQIPGNALISAKKYGSLNTKADRSAIADDEFAWIENWMQLGDGNLRTLWGEGASLYTAPGGKTIVYYYPYNIGAVAYIAVVLSDGSAVQVQISNGATTTIGSSGFYPSSQLPACSQWGSTYLLIVAPTASKDGYWIWDGVLLYGPGTLSPQVDLISGGRNYATPPTVTAYGGSGSGATFSATVDVSLGTVTQVMLTNPGSGYLADDEIALSFSGGGSDTSAVVQAQLDHSSAGVAYCVVTAAGAGYSAATYVTFSAGGSGNSATGILAMENGQIVGVTMTNPGTDYTAPPTITINDPASTPGSGASITAVLVAGQVVSATIPVGGTGYAGPPILTVTGDGQGATAHGVITGGILTSVVMDNPGYGYNHAFITVSGGNAAAAATVTIMPFGVSGTTIETYQERVWVANGTTSLFTAAESLSDFATSDGGGAFPATDSHLRVQIIRYASTSSFLYQFGDSSINVISNVQTSGSPATTTFSNDDVDTQVGAAWRDTVVPFGRALMLANTSGVYALYGGAAEKVSSALDGLFLNADWTFIPTASVATIYGIRVYMLMFKTTDPFGVTRPILAMWDGQKWFVGSQVNAITSVAYQEINSTLTAWGCDGTKLYPLFQAPTTSLVKLWQGKMFTDPGLFYTKQANRAFAHIRNNDTASTTVDIEVDWIDGQGTYHSGASTSQPITVPGNGRVIAKWNPATFGVLLGLECTTTAKDLTMIEIALLQLKDYQANV